MFQTLQKLQNYDVDRWMCSDQCRCVAIEPEEMLRLWPDDEQQQLLASKQFTGSYEDFSTCVERISDNKAYFHANEAALDLIYELEQEFECGGFCEPALFYFYKDIREGPP